MNSAKKNKKLLQKLEKEFKKEFKKRNFYRVEKISLEIEKCRNDILESLKKEILFLKTQSIKLKEIKKNIKKILK